MAGVGRMLHARSLMQGSQGDRGGLPRLAVVAALLSAISLAGCAAIWLPSCDADVVEDAIHGVNWPVHAEFADAYTLDVRGPFVVQTVESNLSRVIPQSMSYAQSLQQDIAKEHDGLFDTVWHGDVKYRQVAGGLDHWSAERNVGGFDGYAKGFEEAMAKVPAPSPDDLQGAETDCEGGVITFTGSAPGVVQLAVEEEAPFNVHSFAAGHWSGSIEYDEPTIRIPTDATRTPLTLENVTYTEPRYEDHHWAVNLTIHAGDTVQAKEVKIRYREGPAVHYEVRLAPAHWTDDGDGLLGPGDTLHLAGAYHTQPVLFDVWAADEVPLHLPFNTSSMPLRVSYDRTGPDDMHRGVAALGDAIEFWQEQGHDVAWADEGGNLGVQFIKDYGSSVLGQYSDTYSDGFMQISLGDSNCLDQYRGFDHATLEWIAKHELGHALGFDHGGGPGNIMDPYLHAKHVDGCLLLWSEDFLEQQQFYEYPLDTSHGTPYYRIEAIEAYGDPIDVCIGASNLDDPYEVHCVEDQAEHDWRHTSHESDRSVSVVCWYYQGCEYEVAATGFDQEP